MRRSSTVAAGTALVLTAIALGGCSSSNTTAASGTRVTKVRFTLTDAGCEPPHLELAAGATTFEVRNDGAGAVTEMEVLHKGRIIGEVENLTPGLSGSFSITLEPGTYETLCPNGTMAARGDIVVSAAPTPTALTPNRSAAAKAVRTYRAYVENEAAQLVKATSIFVDAVKAGKVAVAKKLYPTTRAHYERIESIAESFEELDAEIDARAGDVPSTDFKGFHRIERQLWEQGDTDGMGAVADALLVGTKRLRVVVATVVLEPARIANGAVELMNEVANDKITGEEDRYSHTDLWDFDANTDGAKAAFDALRPLVARTDEMLAAKIDTQFASTHAALARYATIGGGFVSYAELTNAQTRALAAQVDALADSLSKVPPLVVGA